MIETTATIHESIQSRWQRFLPPLLVVIAILIAYCNSFRGPFVYDDVSTIRDNPEIRNIIPRQYSTELTTTTGRPVLRFSFALDYALGGDSPTIYHATNLLIHIASALLLYEIIRRTLLIHQIFAAPWLAAATTAIWSVHPLDTQAVTYISQRAESLASMFYLSAIYCVIRTSQAHKRSWIWGIAAVVSALLGVGCKEMVATVPLTAFLFDATFIAGSLKLAAKKRWPIFAGMLLTGVCVVIQIRTGARGPIFADAAASDARIYAITQLTVIAWYLRLMIVPVGLVLDDDNWPASTSIMQVGWPGALVIALILATIAFMIWRPRIGFAGLWFFLVIAPSSSFVPIVTEIAAEHRMYLPMAGWIALFVVGGWILIEKYGVPRVVGKVAATVVILLFIALTIARNQQFTTAESIWRDNLAKRPTNLHAIMGVVMALYEKAHEYPQGSDPYQSLLHESADYAADCLNVYPDYNIAAFWRARALADAGDLTAADDTYTQELARDPAFVGDGNFLRGKIRLRLKQWQGAKEDFQIASKIHPDDPDTHYLLGLVLEQLNDPNAAADEYEKTLKIAPSYHDAWERMMMIHAGGATTTKSTD